MDIILYVVAIVLVLWAQTKVKGAYQHYAKVETENHLTGAQIAKSILDNKGLSHVQVQMSQNGILTDHFDPKTNTVNLSPRVYKEASIASVAVAAHEVGHAIQYAENYSIIGIRNAILPFAIVSGHLGWFVVIVGLMTSITSLFYLGLGMLLVIASFQLVTLPIEFDASKRALSILGDGQYINTDEIADAKAMLSAAAFTYVAALLATLMQILRILILSNRRRD